LRVTDRIVIVLGIISTLATVLTIKELPPWVPAPSTDILAAIYKFTVVLLVLAVAQVVWRFRRAMDRRLAELESRIDRSNRSGSSDHDDSPLPAVNALVARIAHLEELTLRREPAPLGADELTDIGVIWRWHRDRQEVAGPLCPEHRVKLGYQQASGLYVTYRDIENRRLEVASGWFICPTDENVFKPNCPGTIAQARRRVEDRFRAQLDLPPPPPQPPTEAELEAQRRAADLFRSLGLQRPGAGGDPTP
jgi:hypothetical protein